MTLQAARTITTELVAKTIAGISLIGYAHKVLQTAGWEARIAGNRITVEGVVEAQLISSNGYGWWQVWSIDGRTPVWTVGAHDTTSSSNWMGAD